MKKRLFTFLLALVMVIGAFPATTTSASELSNQLGLEYLLRGYNVLSGKEFNSGNLCTARIVKPGSDATLQGYYDADHLDRTTAATYTGRSVAEWFMKAGVKTWVSAKAEANIGKLGIIKATASTKFSNEINASYKNSSDSLFFNMNVTHESSKNYVNNMDSVATRNAIQSALDPEFLYALLNAKDLKKEIFDVYGTHYITSYGMGGWVETTLSAITTKESITTHLKDKFESSGNVDSVIGSLTVASELETEVEAYRNADNYVTATYSRVYGGRGGVSYSSDAASNTTVINNWINSFVRTGANANCYLLTDDNLKLYGMWELLPPGYEERYNELVYEYTKLAQQQDLAFLNEFLYNALTPPGVMREVTDVREIYGDITEAVESYPYPIPAGAIHIANPSQLAAIGGAQSADKYYVLDNDINLTTEWIPIDDFRGTLDGQGHAINGLLVTAYVNLYRQCSGLIGRVISGTIVIKNLSVNLHDSGVSALITNTASYAGGMIGIVSGSDTNVAIENCSVNGKVYSSLFSSGAQSQAVAGGLIGCCYSGTVSINNSYATGSIEAYASGSNVTNYAGGLVGYVGVSSTPVIIKNCYASNTVIKTGNAPSYLGGLVGSILNGAGTTITSSYTLGEINGNPSLINGWDFDTKWEYIGTKLTLRVFKSPMNIIKPAFILCNRVGKPEFSAGDILNLDLPNGMKIYFTDNLYDWNAYKDITNSLAMQLRYDFSTPGEQAVKIIYSTPENNRYFGVFTIQILSMQEVENSLNYIKVDIPPAKTVYNAGETFDPTGMVVKASYYNRDTEVITGYNYYPTGPLTSADQFIEISYAGKSVAQPITVISQQAAAPAAAPGSGAVAAGAQVSLTGATPGAVIRYTLDGSEPTELSTTYTGAITINASLTLKAKAFAPGYEPSVTAVYSYTVLDVNTPTITVGSVKVTQGERIFVPIAISNNPGVVGVRLDVSFDDTAMALVGFEDKGLLRGANPPSHNTKSPLTLVWQDMFAPNNMGNGALAVLEFEVFDNEPRNYAISVSYLPNNIINSTLQSVFFQVVNGTVEVIDFICGDVNGDTSVDIVDAFVLSRYTAGWAYENIPIAPHMLNINAADVNDDGSVDFLDAFILARHTAGWAGGYEKLPYKPMGVQAAVQLFSMPLLLGAPSIEIAAAAGKAGEKVKVPVSIKNNPGVTGMMFTIDYDTAALKLVGYEDTGLITGALHPPYHSSTPVTFAWMDRLAKINNTSNGAIVILEFEILAGAASGEYAIDLSYTPNNIINAELKPVYFEAVSGMVKKEVDIDVPTGEMAELVNAAATVEDFISIAETGKNSGVWTMSFNVMEIWSDGEAKAVRYDIQINANNANVSGSYNLGAYTLIFDIKGSGSNIKEFSVLMN